MVIKHVIIVILGFIGLSILDQVVKWWFEFLSQYYAKELPDLVIRLISLIRK